MTQVRISQVRLIEKGQKPGALTGHKHVVSISIQTLLILDDLPTLVQEKSLLQ